MRLVASLRSPLGVDPLTVAGAFGAIAGAASLGVPYFGGLAEALAAVALVAWGLRVGQTSTRLPSNTVPLVVGVAAAWAVAVLAPAPFSAGRGALLGASAVALAWQGRRLAPSPEVPA